MPGVDHSFTAKHNQLFLQSLEHLLILVIIMIRKKDFDSFGHRGCREFVQAVDLELLRREMVGQLSMLTVGLFLQGFKLWKSLQCLANWYTTSAKQGIFSCCPLGNSTDSPGTQI